MKSFRTIFWITVFSILAICLFAQAQNPIMIKDINPGVNSAFFSGNNYRVSRDVVNGVFFIQANDGTHGKEVWKSVPPYTDASLVKDLNSGAGDGSIGAYLSAFNKLFFVGGAGAGSALCWSDGTSLGTAALTTGKSGDFTDIVSSQGMIFSHQYYLQIGGTIRVKSTKFYDYLYVTNPVTGTTTYLKTFNYIGWMADINGKLLFSVLTGGVGANDWSLWKSDGTSKGTVKIIDLPIPISNDGYPSEPKLYRELKTYFVAEGFAVYFVHSDATFGTELWKTDGTVSGTMRVTNINAGGGSSAPAMVARMGNYLYFATNDGGTRGYQIWRYPLAGGTAEKVTNIDGGILGANPMWLTTLGDKIFFSANTLESGRELWMSNGLPLTDPNTSTQMVANINSGTASSNPNYYDPPDNVVPSFVDNDARHKFWMEPMGSFVYFPADDGTGFSLWRSDGTTTEKLGSQKPRYLTNINNNTLLFIGYDADYGNELWKYVPPVPKRGNTTNTAMPIGFELLQNYPNPFGGAAIAGNLSTTIRYSIPEDIHVTLKVYDLYSREVATLVDATQKAGIYAVQFHAKDLPSGMYMYRVETEGKMMSRIMTVVK